MLPSQNHPEAQLPLVVQLRQDLEVTVLGLNGDRTITLDREPIVGITLTEEEAHFLGRLMIMPDTLMTPQEVLGPTHLRPVDALRKVRQIKQELLVGLRKVDSGIEEHFVEKVELGQVLLALAKDVVGGVPQGMTLEGKPAVTAKPEVIEQVSAELVREILEKRYGGKSKKPPLGAKQSKLDSQPKSHEDTKHKPKPLKNIKLKPKSEPAPNLKPKPETHTKPETQPEPKPETKPTTKRIEKHSADELNPSNLPKFENISEEQRFFALLSTAKRNMESLGTHGSNRKYAHLKGLHPIDIIIANVVYRGPQGVPVTHNEAWLQVTQHCPLTHFDHNDFEKSWREFILLRLPDNVALKKRLTVPRRRNPQTGNLELGLLWIPDNKRKTTPYK